MGGVALPAALIQFYSLTAVMVLTELSSGYITQLKWCFDYKMIYSKRIQKDLKALSRPISGKDTLSPEHWYSYKQLFTCQR